MKKNNDGTDRYEIGDEIIYILFDGIGTSVGTITKFDDWHIYEIDHNTLIQIEEIICLNKYEKRKLKT
jgi:hypothetical protein